MSAAPVISRLHTGKKPTKRLLGAGLALVAGAAILLVAFNSSDREYMTLPVMAERPVILLDGTALYVQKFEVTVAEWNECHDEGGCTLAVRPRPGKAAETTPATGLSHVDVGEYLAWINDRTGHEFRLPTVAEWEAMAAPVLPEAPDPAFTDPSLTWASAYLMEGNAPRALKPQGSFSQTSEGIADLDGSVWEWTQDCYAGSTEVGAAAYCPAYWAGGEHLSAMSYLIRDPARGGCAVGTPPAHLGMRLVTDKPPPAH